MSERIVNVGIIGTGGIANSKHIPALKKQKNVRIVALCDIIPGKAAKSRDRHELTGADVYEDYRELLARDDIEVVHVCTPNRSHSTITVDALHAGKHVMCEKPMAINSEEARKMLKASEESGKKLTIGYQGRNRMDSLYMKREADEGTFGEIYYAKALAIRRRAVPTWGVFLNEYEQGGGPLIDIGTHALDLTLWMMNNYRPKYCVGTTFHKLNNDTQTGNAWGDWDPEKFTVEDSAFGFIVMENGATITLESSWALNYADPIEAKTLICGTKGGADRMDGLRINGVRGGAQYMLRPQLDAKGVAFYDASGKESPAEREARLWIESIIDPSKKPVVDPKEAYCVTRILEGIYTSAKTGDIYRFEND